MRGEGRLKEPETYERKRGKEKRNGKPVSRLLEGGGKDISCASAKAVTKREGNVLRNVKTGNFFKRQKGLFLGGATSQTSTKGKEVVDDRHYHTRGRGPNLGEASSHRGTKVERGVEKVPPTDKLKE